MTKILEYLTNAAKKYDKQPISYKTVDDQGKGSDEIHFKTFFLRVARDFKGTYIGVFSTRTGTEHYIGEVLIGLHPKQSYTDTAFYRALGLLQINHQW